MYLFFTFFNNDFFTFFLLALSFSTLFRSRARQTFLCPPMASCGSFSAFTTTQKTLRSKEKLTNGRFLTTQRSGKRREEFLSKIFTSRGVAEVLFALERAHLRLLFFCKIAAILQKILSVNFFF